MDLHFTRAAAACDLRAPAACALGRTICMLCSLSSLALIHPPAVLAAAAAATAMLRCGVPFDPRARSSVAQLASSPRRHPDACRPFEFVWKGNLSANGITEEGVKRVGRGFADMMRSMQLLQGGGCFRTALVDVQVMPFAHFFLYLQVASNWWRAGVVCDV